MREFKILWVLGALALYAVLSLFLLDIVRGLLFFECLTECGAAELAPYETAFVVGGGLILLIGAIWVFGPPRKPPIVSPSESINTPPPDDNVSR